VSFENFSFFALFGTIFPRFELFIAQKKHVILKIQNASSRRRGFKRDKKTSRII
jgi:hypothetical protein